MVFKQFYLSCLAHASYLIASGDEAVVVDPQRDVDQYIEEATGLGARIRYIIETHLHADFVSGHKELAQRTGAEILIGASAGAAFSHHPVREGHQVRIGTVVLRAMETPGHTPEGISWVVSDDADLEAPLKVLTGDTLFIGDVGRPDLAGAKGYTAEVMAGLLYDSLHGKLLALPDDTEVWPAHGAGSMCGRNISKETTSTIGTQRKMNYAVQPMSRPAFVSMMTSDLSPAPAYFAMDVEINRQGAGAVKDITAVAMSAQEVRRNHLDGAILLDVRDGDAFGHSHIPGSVNIGLGGQFASWAATLLPPTRPIIVIASSPAESHQAIVRLARVGLENVRATLDGGIASWHAAGYPLETLTQMTIDELRVARREGNLQVLDVRGAGEFTSGHVPSAINIPLAQIPQRRGEIDHTRPTAVICAGGYRSSAAASLLLSESWPALYNVTGGTGAWVKAGLETEG